MAKFYSKTTRGFYDDTLHQTLPSDAVAVTDATYNALFVAQESGQQIVPDTNGNPIAVAVTPTPAQLAANAINAGLTISSTSTPAINGTYAVDANAQSKLNAVTTYVMLNNAFPANQSAMPWADMSGAAHALSIANFKAFATAIANYVAELDLYANGALTTIPANTVTIA
jgi:hypothetical protein